MKTFLLLRITKSVRYFATCPKDAPSIWLFPHPLAWAALAGLGIIVVAWAEISGFRFTSLELLSAALPLTLLITTSLWCIYRKILPVFPYFTFTLLFYLIMNMIFKSGNCLGVALGFPMVDAQMVAFDQMIGFDWPAHVRWVNDHAFISNILDRVYSSLDGIMLVTVLTLFALQRYDRLKELIILVLATGTITLIFGTLWPMWGPFNYYDLPAGDIANLPNYAGRYHLDQLLAIRDGTLRQLDLSDYQGLICFPSFHTILALLTSWVLRRTFIFWPMALINAIMIISTLSYGGHHLADVFGGIVVAVVIVWIYGRAHDRFLTSDNNAEGLPNWLHTAIFRLTGARPNEQQAPSS